MAHSVRSPPEIAEAAHLRLARIGADWAQALILAMGFAMTGYVNFYLGVSIMTLAIVAITVNLWLRTEGISNNIRGGSVIAIIGLYGIGLWFLFVAAPLIVAITMPPGNYPVDQDVFGVKWKQEYYPVTYIVENETANDYDHYDSYVRTNKQITKVAIRNSLNQCIASPEIPGSLIYGWNISHPENGKIVSVPIFQDQNDVVSTDYRIRCDKISSNSRIEIVLAIIGGKPDWATVSSKYVAVGRSRLWFASQCLSPPCENVPTSAE
jgi:hypothetical protein